MAECFSLFMICLARSPCGIELLAQQVSRARRKWYVPAYLKDVSTPSISPINITFRGRYTTIQPKEVDTKPSNTVRAEAPAERGNLTHKEGESREASQRDC